MVQCKTRGKLEVPFYIKKAVALHMLINIGLCDSEGNGFLGGRELCVDLVLNEFASENGSEIIYLYVMLHQLS